jgi:hypothetical protein
VAQNLSLARSETLSLKTNNNQLRINLHLNNQEEKSNKKKRTDFLSLSLWLNVRLSIDNDVRASNQTLQHSYPKRAERNGAGEEELGENWILQEGLKQQWRRRGRRNGVLSLSRSHTGYL